MTIVNNDCECAESGECSCDPDFCACECGCEDCTIEYVSEDGECECGGNCGCSVETEYNEDEDNT